MTASSRAVDCRNDSFAQHLRPDLPGIPGIKDVSYGWLRFAGLCDFSDPQVFVAAADRVCEAGIYGSAHQMRSVGCHQHIWPVNGESFIRMPGRKKQRLNRVVFAFVLFTLNARFTFCQLNSSAASVVLIATLESLSIAATPTIAIPLVSGGTATNSFPIAITTAWAVRSSRTTIRVVGYFALATSALSTGDKLPSNVPAATILGQVTTGVPITFTAFTETAALGPAGAGLTLFTQPVGGTNLAATRTDRLNLDIDRRSQPRLCTRAYTGTLNIRVEAL